MTHHIPIPPPKWLQRHIRNTLTYYPKSGYLIWTNPDPQAHNIKPGDHAGSINSGGYLKISFEKNKLVINILVHHICWFLYYGKWPTKEIDHQDTNKLNNKIRNLRLAKRNQGSRNRGLLKNNTSGVTGVCWVEKRSKWQSTIKYKHKCIFLGRFPNFNDAVHARQQAEKKYFGRWRYTGH
jgi:HNH endonuclease